jgi:hypothetical protein
MNATPTATKIRPDQKSFGERMRMGQDDAMPRFQINPAGCSPGRRWS